MKKLLIICVVFALAGCAHPNPTNSGSNHQPLPKTKTVCDLFGNGIVAESIISEQLDQGYEFTGSTKGMICENVLHFRLIEKED